MTIHDKKMMKFFKSPEDDKHKAEPATLEELRHDKFVIEQVHQEWLAALDVVKDPIFLHDKKLRILRCNKAYQQQAGMSFSELLGKPFYDVFPKYAAPCQCCLGEIKGAVVGDEEITIGDVVYHSRAFPVIDSNGKFLYSAHILENVTERKKIESDLKQSQKFTQDVIDNSPLLFYSLDKDGRFILANNRLLSLLGIDRSQLIGYTREVVMHKHEAEEHRKNDIEVMRTAIPIEFEESNFHTDGTRAYLSQKFPLFDTEGNVYGVCGISTDITQHKKNELALQRANRALRTLSAGNVSLIRSTDELQLLQAICQVAVEKGGYHMAWVGYVEHDAERSIRFMAKAGIDEGNLEQAHITWNDNEYGQEPTGKAARIGQTQVAQNIARDPKIMLWREQAEFQGYTSSIALPLLEREQCFGVLTICAAEADAFDSEEMVLLEEMAADLAFGILTLRIKQAHSEHEQRLQKNMLQTVEAIASIVEMRDPYTSGHQARVAKLAQAIAYQMGLPAEQIRAIRLAGVVHDLGKISVPAEILSKPGRLNDIEFSLIKMHSQAGYDILKGIDFSWPIAQTVLQHHERMDGSGYPQGLKGEEILLDARILSVADIVEAMFSHRPYRPGLGIEAALGEITRARGTQYDPQVVDACVALFREHGYVLSN
jgi:PAS domain S-box-containing protein